MKTTHEPQDEGNHPTMVPSHEMWYLKILKSNFYYCIIKEKRRQVMSMLSESLCIIFIYLRLMVCNCTSLLT